jgi:hypothetical protein
MTRLVVSILLLCAAHAVNGQSYSVDKVALANFLKRMYIAAPFDGVKVLDDYNAKFLVSVVALNKAKYPSEATLNRVAQVKAQSQASTFLNGATISMDMVITTKESTDNDGNVDTLVETVERIKQNSVGFSQGLELLNTFDHPDGLSQVFVYVRELK